MLGMGVYLGVSFAAYDELSGALPKSREFRSSAAYAFGKMAAGAGAGMLGQVS